MQTFIFQNQLLGSAVAMIVWELDLQLPVQCPLQVWAWILFMASCTRYNCRW